MTQDDHWVTQDDPWVNQDDQRVTQDDPWMTQDDSLTASGRYLLWLSLSNLLWCPWVTPGNPPMT